MLSAEKGEPGCPQAAYNACARWRAPRQSFSIAAVTSVETLFDQVRKMGVTD